MTSNAFNYGGQSIDDKIVSEALGGHSNVLDVEAEVVSSGPKKTPFKKKVLHLLIIGLLGLVGVGALLSQNGESGSSRLSAEGADLTARSESAAMMQAKGKFVAEEQKEEKTHAPQQIAAAPPESMAKEFVATLPHQSVSPAVPQSTQAPAQAQAPQGTKPVAAIPVQPFAAKPAAPSLVAETKPVAAVQNQEAYPAGATQPAPAKEEVHAVPVKRPAESRVVVKPVVVDKKPTDDARVVAKKSSGDPAQVGIVLVLTDGVVLTSGEVVDVGGVSKKLGGKLTAVNPSMNLIEVDGSPRSVNLVGLSE